MNEFSTTVQLSVEVLFRHAINMFNVEFVAALIGLVSAHLPRSYSLQYAHAHGAS